MKRPVTVLFFVLAAALAACTQSAEPKKEATPSIAAGTASTETVVAEITRLENEWVTAIIKKDVAALENLLAEDFNGTSPTGVPFPRQTRLRI